MDSFFGIGLFELVMIAVVALVVLGPERLPAAMREVAKWMRQLRGLSSEFQSQFSEEFKLLDEMDPRRIINEAIDPKAKPGPATTATAKSPTTQQPAKPLAAKPVTPPALKPQAAAATTAAVTLANGETQNTILPPKAKPEPTETATGETGAMSETGAAVDPAPLPETTDLRAEAAPTDAQKPEAAQ